MIEEDKLIKDTFQDFFSWWKTGAKNTMAVAPYIMPVEVTLQVQNMPVIDMPVQPVEITADYILIADQNALEEECNKRMSAEALGIDVETTGLDPYLHNIRLIQVAVKGLPVMVIDTWAVQSLGPVNRLFQGTGLKVFQNGKFDLKMLHMAGLPVEGHLFDTMLASQLITGGLREKREGNNLKDLAKRYLNMDLSKEQQDSNWSDNLSEEQIKYASLDVQVLLPLQEILNDLLVKKGLETIAQLEFACLYSVVDLELNGFYLDPGKQESIKGLLKSRIDQAELAVRADLGDINLRSPKQLLPVLSEKTGLRLKSTSKDYLMAAGHPLFSMLIDYKEQVKFYEDNFLRLPDNVHEFTGRVHANYWQLGAATGRFSCTNPPLQTIPRDKKIRDCFMAESGNKLVIADYSQIELRIAAEISRDAVMIDAYSRGQDLHTLTASFLTGKAPEEISKNDRQLAKAVNFGLIYGAGADTLRNYAKFNYGIELSGEEAKKFRKKFFKLYRGLYRWQGKVNHRRDYITYTLGKRYRKFSKRDKFRLTDRLNSPVQGTGADILKKALVMLRSRIAGMAKLVHIVHDEIILECHENRAEEAAVILKDTMEQAGREFLKLVPVEVEVSIGDSWAEK